MKDLETIKMLDGVAKKLAINVLEDQLADPDNSAEIDKALQLSIAKIEGDKEFIEERV